MTSIKSLLFMFLYFARTDDWFFLFIEHNSFGFFSKENDFQIIKPHKSSFEMTIIQKKVSKKTFKTSYFYAN